MTRIPTRTHRDVRIHNSTRKALEDIWDQIFANSDEAYYDSFEVLQMVRREMPDLTDLEHTIEQQQLVIEGLEQAIEDLDTDVMTLMNNVNVLMQEKENLK